MNCVDLQAEIHPCFRMQKTFFFHKSSPANNKAAGQHTDSHLFATSKFYMSINEPRCEKTGLRDFDLVRHKPGCSATEDG